MNNIRILAKDYKTKQSIYLHLSDGVIEKIEPANGTHDNNVWVAPPLFDLQVNGFAGVDFQSENIGLDDLIVAVRRLQRAGCARFLLTLITADWEKMLSKLSLLRKLRKMHPELQKSIVGWHIEGPFLSDKPGFHGIHNPKFMIDPTPEHLYQLREATMGDPVLITLAPERNGAIDAIKLAVKLGFQVNLGHTDASLELLKLAIQAGAKGFTHFANGCPRLLDRRDNIIWRVFELEGIKISVIPDNIHVSSTLFRLIHKFKPADDIFYVSDAISAADSKPGRYRLGEIEVEVGEDGYVWDATRTYFAGSSLRPFDGVFRAANIVGCPWQDAWRRYSEIPMQFMGLNFEIKEGQKADFCLVKISQNQPPFLEQIFVSGEPAFK